ncbi:hypothetical protein [Veillonella caviae]|uniref:hypothetical protein n=1 Tax=Veillonella caviae TaxID=248316 RepID=UPI002A917EF8|nr:hypothetical protein [Veillonella caviae]MDY6224391.1 hypothetical protein [Veillonella caviae]
MNKRKYILDDKFDRASAFLDLPKERQLKIINWIHMYFIPIKSCNYQVMSSYGLKHLYERWMYKFEGKSEYLSNGELKGAMFAAGFSSNDYETSQHCHFNISKTSLNLLHEILNSEYRYVNADNELTKATNLMITTRLRGEL